MSKAYMIMDMQFGSTGKGLLAGYLAEYLAPDVCVTAWAPNAGHTYINSQGRKFVHRMLANGIVSHKLTHVLIGAGSVIDLDILAYEIFECIDLLQGKTIIIHPNAAIVNADHVHTEKRNIKIGSTMKGTGAAMIQRIERDPDNMNTAEHAISQEWFDKVYNYGVDIYVSRAMYDEAIQKANLIQIEGAQGFSLSIYHGFYPYTTSRDVTPAQVMADCCIPFDIIPEVYGTLRTYPIRVANRYDASGKMVGTSGGCYDDQMEINWEDIGLKPELTTVTKLPRRLFTFSMMQLCHAVKMCNPTKVFVNFANYMEPSEFMQLLEQIDQVCEVGWIGMGATVGDVVQHHNRALTRNIITNWGV